MGLCFMSRPMYGPCPQSPGPRAISHKGVWHVAKPIKNQTTLFSRSKYVMHTYFMPQIHQKWRICPFRSKMADPTDWLRENGFEGHGKP